MEKLRSTLTGRSIRGAGFAGLVLLGAAGCANYSGEGNEFVVRGQVTDPSSQSLEAEIYMIQETHGAADGWFEEGNKHRMHDNCDCHGLFHGRHQYGMVLDMSGVEIEPADVPEGACVEFTGKIRSDQDGKYYNDRPVYDMAQIITCGE